MIINNNMFGFIISIFTYLYNSYYYTDTINEHYKTIRKNFKFNPSLSTINEDNEYCYKTESDYENEEMYNQSLIIKETLKLFIDFIEENENENSEQLLRCLKLLYEFPISDFLLSGHVKKFTDSEKEYNNKKQAFSIKFFKLLMKIDYNKVFNYIPSEEYKNKITNTSKELLESFTEGNEIFETVNKII